MFKISVTPLPQDALLCRYQTAPGCYTDCFQTTTARAVGVAQFVDAFYTAPLFRLERWILNHLAGHPSTDQQARDIARGAASNFAAWEVEDRNDCQLLVSDLRGATRSWFMTQPDPAGGTRLCFGSAVTPAKDREELSVVVRWFMPLHRIYARLLLAGARNRLNRDRY